ncbi:MAG: hypothetical protein J5781_07370 [Clostridia bacterium]|nr:hypothetical protein [Clostridia bacterium]
MAGINNNVTDAKTMNKNNVFRLFSGLIVLLGDIVMILGIVFSGLSLFNVPFSIDYMKDLFSDFSVYMKHFSEDYVTLEITIVLIVLAGVSIAAIVKSLIGLIRFFKLFRLTADEETGRKNYSSFLRATGGVYAICGGTALCSAAVNPELPVWSIVMICLSIVYIVIVAGTECCFHFPENGVGRTVLQSVGAFLLCGVVLAATLLYAKPVLTSVYDGLNNFVVYSYNYAVGELIMNLQNWVRLMIGMVAGAMLASTIYAVSPIYNAKGKMKLGISGFVYGIVTVVLAIVMSIVETVVFTTEKSVVYAIILEMIPLLLCSVVGLVITAGAIVKE